MAHARPRTVAIFAIGVVAAALSGCAGGDDRSAPPVATATPSARPASTSPEDFAKPTIIGVFDGFMHAYVTAAGTADATNADLLKYGGESGGNVALEFPLWRLDGITATGTPTWSDATVTQVDLPADRATVTACFDVGTWRTVKGGTPATPQEANHNPPPEPARAGDAPGTRYRVTSQMQLRQGGRWIVFVLERGSQSC